MVVLLVCIEEFSPMDEFCPVSGQGSQTSKGNLTRVAIEKSFPLFQNQSSGIGSIFAPKPNGKTIYGKSIFSRLYNSSFPI